MELCSLTDAARQNIEQTYMGLAQQLTDSRAIHHANFKGMVSLRPYSFCNFLMGFHGLDDDLDVILSDLDRWTRMQPAMRVFVMSGDEPRGIAPALMRLGFAPLHRLLQMVWYPARTLGQEQWQLSLTQDSRRLVSEFMVKQFFSLNEAAFRTMVVDATVAGDHQLWQLSEEGAIVAAAMATPTQGAVGIYNVCVDASMRRRGYGTALMRSAQLHAFAHGVPLVLQCEEGLSEWYRELGFQVFGEMQSFQRRI